MRGGIHREAGALWGLGGGEAGWYWWGVGVWRVINGKHYLTNWSCFQEGSFLTRLRSEKRRIINRNFPMLSIRPLPPHGFKLSSQRTLQVRLWLKKNKQKKKNADWESNNLLVECTGAVFFAELKLTIFILFEQWLVVPGVGWASDARLQEESITLNLRLWARIDPFVVSVLVMCMYHSFVFEQSVRFLFSLPINVL